ncbi:30S ribosomal protein S2 [Patescibacteria group bacterium]|nr:30S ribosomal protein S2 [Patescibacteria group bacterium]
MKIPSSLEMLKAGVHFGHQKSRWHPKMKPFIYGVKSGVHVINVEKTAEALQRAGSFVTAATSRGGSILFVGTKAQAQDIVAKAAKEAGMPYVNTRWLGGTLTNFAQIQRLIRHYLDLKDKREKGDLKKYTKLEQLQFDREIAELDEKIGGMSTVTRLPDAIFVLDARVEKTAVREAIAMGVPVIAAVDTNVNPVGITYVIPANDDARGSLELIANTIGAAALEGKKQSVVPAEAKKDKIQKLDASK